MNLADKEAQKLRIIVNLMFLAISLYGISQKGLVKQDISPFEQFLMDTFAPIQDVLSTSRDNIFNFVEHYMLNVNASKENKVLLQELTYQKQKFFELQEIKKENERLKKLLDFVEQRQEGSVLAKIVAFDASSDHKVIRINRGLKDGVRVYSPVMSSSGLVGYIFRASKNYSDILTVLDPNNKVDGVVDRIRSHGILEGFSNGKCLMKYISRTEPVILNDQVVTSGLGRIYPKGIKVGTISKIERQAYGITQRIEVTPAVDFSRLEEVVVLLVDDRQDDDQEWSQLDNMQLK